MKSYFSFETGNIEELFQILQYAGTVRLHLATAAAEFFSFLYKNVEQALLKPFVGTNLNLMEC